MVSRAVLSTLEAAYRQWDTTKAGSQDQFLALMTDDFTMGSLAAGAAGMRFSRDHVSIEQARIYFAEMLRDWEMVFFNVRDYVAQGSEVAVICECCWRHKATGHLVHSPKLDLWKFKGRKAIGFFEYFDTDQAIGVGSGQPSRHLAPPAPLYPKDKPSIHDSLDETARANIRKLKRFFKRYEGTKGAAYGEIVDMLAPTLTWMSLANGARGVPFTVKRTSVAEVEGYFKALFEEWEMISYKHDDFIAGGPYIVAHGRVEFRNTRTNRVCATPKADIVRFDKDRIVEFMEYYDTAGIIRAATAS